MIPEARALRDAMARVYRPWLVHLFETRHWELAPEPFDRQRRGPLELFQEAMQFPTAALSELGVEAVERDPIADQALPGDVFDLAPASSSTLGETVWHAHLAWGAAKANAMRQT